MYKYETHLHTLPASLCAKVWVREALEFYKSIGYDGVFITNHFLDGNTAISDRLPYEERVNIYFEDVEEGREIGEEIGIKVFSGVEMSYMGTDFLVYGLEKEWYAEHPEIMEMTKREEMAFLMENGAFIVQAHPFREAKYIDHIRLFPKSVNAVEVCNASMINKCPTANVMADYYADQYGLLKIAGSDNHVGERIKVLAGIETDTPAEDEKELIEMIRAGKARLFTMENPLTKE